MKHWLKRWQCRKGHLQPYVRKVFEWFEYESELCYAECWECKHCGQQWSKRISAIEARKWEEKQNEQDRIQSSQRREG